MRPIGLKHGDLPVIQELTKMRGMNRGKGYSYSTVKSVLSLGTRRNKLILELAKEYVHNRKQFGRRKTA